MKVKDLIGRYRCCSNASVVIQTSGETISELTPSDVKNNRYETIIPETIMNSTVGTFQIMDNVLTIHIK